MNASSIPLTYPIAAAMGRLSSPACGRGLLPSTLRLGVVAFCLGALLAVFHAF